MASLEEIQEFLQPTNISVTAELDDRFIGRFQRVEIHIPKNEVDKFVEVKEQITVDPETAIFYPGHYEQLIEIQSPIPTSRAFRGLTRNDEDALILSNVDESMSVEISKASTCFLLGIFQSVNFRVLRNRGLMSPEVRDRRRGQENSIHWSEAFRRIQTIQVQATAQSSHYGRRNKLQQIAEAALFHFSYGTGTGLNLSRSWERSYQRLKQRREEQIQFPRRTYNSDLVSYYQLALSSDSLMLGYIALYKILEYFFLSSSESVLHKRLAEKLIQPDFSHSKISQLRLLASLIRKYDQRMDEQRMLTTVIEHYFRPDEMTIWVNEYENNIGNYFTVPQIVFGQSFTLDLNPDNFASSLSKRIYHIRNTLVHNKEGELPRFIPFSGQEAILSSEIPIILFLAEQLILKTGEDI